MRLQKRQTGFAQVANAVLNDRAISAKAKGIYAYLWSKPDDWDFSVERISADFTDGPKALYSGMKELEVAGYVERLKQGDGRMVYMLHLETAQARRTGVDPVAGNGEQEGVPNSPFGLVAETGGISNTVKSQTKTEVTENAGGPGKSEPQEADGFADFWSLYPKKVDKRVVASFWEKMSGADRSAAAAGLRRWRDLWLLPGQAAFVIDPIRFLRNRRFDEEVLRTVLEPRLADAAARGKGGITETGAARLAREASEAARIRREAEEKERLRKDAEAKDFADRVLRFFESLPDDERRRIEAETEASLAERGITPQPYPAVYKAARNSKIVQLTRPWYDRFVMEA